MLDSGKAYSGFAVDDVGKAREFYGETLGLNVAVLDRGNSCSSSIWAGASRS